MTPRANRRFSVPVALAGALVGSLAAAVFVAAPDFPSAAAPPPKKGKAEKADKPDGTPDVSPFPVPGDAVADDWNRLILRDGRELTGRLTKYDGVVILENPDRRIALPVSQVNSREKLDASDPPAVIRVAVVPPRKKGTKPVSASATDIRFGPVDAAGRRSVTLTDPALGGPGGKPVTLTQQITEIGPRMVRWETVEHEWGFWTPLRLFDKNLINTLLAGNLDLTKPANRLVLARFLRQADLFGDAEAMLDALAGMPGADAADIKDGAALERKRLQAAYAGRLLHDLRLALHRGDYAAAESVAAEGKPEWLPAGPGRAEWEKLARQAATGRKLAAAMLEELTALYSEVSADSAAAQGMTCKQAAALLREGIHPDQALAAEAVRVKAAEGALATDRLAALTAALTFGPAAGSLRAASPERLEKLLAARADLRAHLGSSQLLVRQAIRNKLWRNIRDVTPADLAALVRGLGAIDPPAPDPKAAPDPKTPAEGDFAEEKTAAGRRIVIAPRGYYTPGRVEYVIRLPSTYHPGRDCPLLIALYAFPGGPEDALKLWADAAERWGFALLCPPYGAGTGPVFGYRNDPAQHGVVLDALRDAVRRYRIDPDRVFLAGHGSGATAAWALAMCRTDLFAGVAPFVGGPPPTLDRYFPHLSRLSVYSLDADRAGPSHLFSRWGISRLWPIGADAQYTEMVGRGAEPFSEEMDAAMDFLARRRRPPLPDRLDFCSFRRSEARYGWLEIESVAGITAWKLDVPVKPPVEENFATVSARVSNNTVRIETDSVDSLRVYVVPELFDLDRPVTVIVNGKQVHSAVVRPSLDTVLVQTHAVHDRGRVFWGVIDVKCR